ASSSRRGCGPRSARASWARASSTTRRGRRSAGRGGRRTSPPCAPSSSATKRATSPARSWGSTVAATPDGPRIAPLPPGEWPDEMREALAALRPPNPRHPLPSRAPGRPKGLNALGLLARHPELTRAYHGFNGHVLFASTLSPRDRELLILRVASVRQAEYEWAQHVVQAGDAGLTADEIARVAAGPDAAGWSALDAAMLTAVDELIF